MKDLDSFRNRQQLIQQQTFTKEVPFIKNHCNNDEECIGQTIPNMDLAS